MEEMNHITWNFCEFLDASSAVGDDASSIIFTQLYQQHEETDIIIGMYNHEAKKMAIAILKSLAENGDEQCQKALGEL